MLTHQALDKGRAVVIGMQSTGSAAAAAAAKRTTESAEEDTAGADTEAGLVSPSLEILRRCARDARTNIAEKRCYGVSIAYIGTVHQVLVRAQTPFARHPVLVRFQTLSARAGASRSSINLPFLSRLAPCRCHHRRFPRWFDPWVAVLP